MGGILRYKIQNKCYKRFRGRVNQKRPKKKNFVSPSVPNHSVRAVECC